jgi:hypothetical protein
MRVLPFFCLAFALSGAGCDLLMRYANRADPVLFNGQPVVVGGKLTGAHISQ